VSWLLLLDDAPSSAKHMLHEVGYCRTIKNDEYEGMLMEVIMV
jgi:hypothetical protein